MVENKDNGLFMSALFQKLTNKAAFKQIEYTKKPVDVAVQTIADWKEARESALATVSPLRSPLMVSYEKALLDAHLSALIRARKAPTVGADFELLNTAGEVDQEATEKAAEFIDEFFSLVIDGVFWGAQNIQIDNVDAYGVPKFSAMRRRNLEPFSRRFLKDETQYSDGIDYTKPRYKNYLVCMDDDPYDLGLLNIAVPYAVILKALTGNWATGSERAGVPAVIAKTDISNLQAVAQLKQGLEAFAKNPKMILDNTDVIEVLPNSGDVYLVYRELANFIESNLSKLILGSTMTTDSGSSRSQSEVHERTTAEIIKQDNRLCERVFNRQGLQKLKALGVFGQNIARGRFADRDRRSLDDKFKIDSELMRQGAVFSVDYLNEKYKTQIESFAAPQPTTPPENLGK